MVDKSEMRPLAKDTDGLHADADDAADATDEAGVRTPVARRTRDSVRAVTPPIPKLSARRANAARDASEDAEAAVAVAPSPSPSRRLLLLLAALPGVWKSAASASSKHVLRSECPVSSLDCEALPRAGVSDGVSDGAGCVAEAATASEAASLGVGDEEEEVEVPPIPNQDIARPGGRRRSGRGVCVREQVDAGPKGSLALHRG